MHFKCPNSFCGHCMYKHNGEWSELTHFQALNVVSSTSQRDIDVFRHLFWGTA